jgi:uncharacterized protein (DUF305 family)
MSKSILIAIIFSLIAGLGIGFSIGKSADPFKIGNSMTSKSKKMTSDLGAKDSEFDKRFIDEMIAHHEGAIDMANQALKNSEHQEIKNTANDIISAQSNEINQMKQWREEWHGNR